MNKLPTFEEAATEIGKGAMRILEGVHLRQLLSNRYFNTFSEEPDTMGEKIIEILVQRIQNNEFPDWQEGKWIQVSNWRIFV